MKVRCAIWMAAFGFLASSPLSGQEFQKIKIAVLDFQQQGEGFASSDMGAMVAEWFITALVKEGRFDVVERGLLNKVLEEQKLAMTGMVDPNTATQLGRLLGVKVIISGSVMRLEDIIEINARIIDVESASIITAENVKSTTATRLEDLVIQMSEKIIMDFPLEGYVVLRDGNRVKIDLGKRMGVKPGMEFLVFREGSVIKHPKTGEVLQVEKIETGSVVIDDVFEKISEGRIILEKAAGSVAYGQRVTSINSDEEVPDFNGLTETKPSSINRTTPTVAPMDVDTHTIISRLRSHDPDVVRRAAGEVVRLSLYYRDILDVVSDVLLVGLSPEINDKQHVEAMIALCEVLGYSGLVFYEETLQRAVTLAPNKKLRKAAQENLDALKYINIIRTRDPAIIRKQLPGLFSSSARQHTGVLNAARDVLLWGYLKDTEDPIHIDGMAWLCKVLREGKQPVYKETLKKVARETPSKKLRKYAK